MILTGFITDTFAASRLFKCSTELDIDYSFKVFSYIENPNAFIFNTMIRAFIQRNSPQKAFFLYKLMLNDNVGVDNYTYPLIAQASALRLSVFEGKLIHDHVVKVGFDSDVYVNNTLINMYAVCGNLCDARKLFDVSPVLDLVSWNSILAGYVNAGNLEEAKDIYDRMPERNIIASNSMIVLFGRRGYVNEACRLFNQMPKKDLVSWSALISCYEQNEMYEEALVMFMTMNDHKVMVDEVVVVSVLSACAHLTVVTMGKLIHNLVVKIGIESYVNLQNALIHMYSSCGEIISAEKLFNAGYSLDLISWNSMISGYWKCGDAASWDSA
ncbi:hypothetical protein Pint_19558 [Pistacia integerrima]|uniref:Uncharacterized protein n=1 Tax=Pistacia integerrima TaxID=434235 RepID=A0ACC0XB29_9ROSI|nr:hypothetical protein Pint_19558 [Pistacia integerrima]